MAGLEDEKLIHLFSTPVLTYQWPDSAAMNRSLKRRIAGQATTRPTEPSLASGGWQSGEDYRNWGGKHAQELMDRAAAMVMHASNQIYATYRRGERSSWSIAMWANIYNKGDFHRSHSHPGATWSGAYYVDPGSEDKENPYSGTLALFNPNTSAPMSFYRSAVPMRYIVHPEPGLMVIWPSYLLHMMHPYTGRRARVSITFNVKKDPYP